MGALVRAKDWSTTPLGPVESWSSSLRTMVSILLVNRFPMLLWWGPDYISIYNDAYRPVLGTKHPWALGRPVREVWSEIEHVIRPLIDAPFNGGPATWMDDLPLELNRHGFVEEAHFTIAYSPVPDDTTRRGIGGVLATVNEITDKIVGERRIVALRDLGAHSGDAKTAEEACAIAANTLAAHGNDVPFALLYLIDRNHDCARLSGSAGIESGHAAAPDVIEFGRRIAEDAVWPLTDILRSGASTIVENLASRLVHPPPGPWSDPPHTALVVPLWSSAAHQLAGFMVAGISPRLKLDEQYRSFLHLLAAQIETAVSTARAYEEERKRAEALAEIDRSKTIFFSSVSHEFRTPLTLMLGPVADALGDSSDPLSPGQRGRLEVAQRNSLRLLKLVNTLLDFSRIEAGRAQVNYVPTDLAALTAELASNFRSAIEKAGLSLIVDCAPLTQPVHVDREMWEKIVLNLLSNAFKFTFDGEIALTLSARIGRAELTVRDTGVGVPPHELPRLFERFHRIEGQKSRTHEGSGIGLALVQELVRLHGGEIRAASRPGEGTTFTVGIPFGVAHLPSDRIAAGPELASTSVRPEAYVEEALRWLSGTDGEVPSAAQAGEDEGVARREAGRVLVADDNADMRAYVERLLSGRWEVETVPDGVAALAAIRRRRPDLVLADVMMPELDGFGLLHAIRDDPGLRDTPVVMLSARAGDEASSEGLTAGADDYLVKPFTARELIARVQGSLAVGRMRRETLEDARLRDERKTFLLHLSDNLRSQADSKAVMANAAELLGQHLKVGRSGYGEIDPAQEYITVEEDWTVAGMPSFVGRHHLDSFGPSLIAEYRHGRTIRVEDALTDPRAVAGVDGAEIARTFARIDTRAGIGVPLVKGGRWVAVLFVHQAQPRRWTDDEVSLVEEVAERTWAVVERARAEARQQVLVNELNHRVKNTLAMVRSITSSTLRDEKLKPGVRESIDARLAALSKGHEVLTRHNWEGAEMRQIVSTALQPFRSSDDRFKINGPVVHLNSKAALSLTMCLHELATNATKYGALSGERGDVKITWSIEGIDAPRFRFLWKEADGPTVKAPARKGFGSRLIERSLPYDLHGEVKVDYQPEGVTCVIDVPLAGVWAHVDGVHD